MTDYERTTVRESEADPAPGPYGDRVRTRETAYTSGPTPGEMIRRTVMLLFGILQGLIILRIVLLLLVANQGNEIVAAIINFTDIFVEPFRGMFSLDRVTANQGSVLDIAAIVALIGWTLIEAVVIALLSVGARRGEDATA
jgi:prepilin signal peptidase PulO-like enzyme (type II secretory pathway)